MSYFPLKDLPPTLFELLKLESLSLYGSNLAVSSIGIILWFNYWLSQQISPLIGNFKDLRSFTPYTSYSLHFLPYEILQCTKLTDMTISTRAMYPCNWSWVFFFDSDSYGNYKNHLPFPNLETFSPYNLVPDNMLSHGSFNQDRPNDNIHSPFELNLYLI